ncbi:hypothetical protein H920_06928 [Fukomys damarensis]|uniref:Uncharacterized protein n=1 Tax=Fukomys damarensis TaxID=885580 RepID=A0A091DI06_FUKDA|nr:hypothetical protein H920_06928 [Fukomys damarensis]
MRCQRASPACGFSRTAARRRPCTAEATGPVLRYRDLRGLQENRAGHSVPGLARLRGETVPGPPVPEPKRLAGELGLSSGTRTTLAAQQGLGAAALCGA